MAWDKEKQKAYMAIYREANKEKQKAYMAAYQVVNREKLAERRRKHAEKRKTQFKDWYANNRERMNAYWRDKRARDIQYRVSANLRARVRDRVRNAKSSKTEATMKLLGCSVDFFMDYISSKFQEGMSWENYGEWHLDHIKPLYLSENEEDLLLLNHYTNLQPLWAKDNLRKNRKYD